MGQVQQVQKVQPLTNVSAAPQPGPDDVPDGQRKAVDEVASRPTAGCQPVNQC